MYPDEKSPLNYSSPCELLIAVILSAQCTDERVNLVTPVLFHKYSTPFTLALASQQDIEKIIFSTGFYKNKAKNIRETAKIIVSEFKGEVPSIHSELMTLPGVARKTANVILSNIWNVPCIAVDTHVRRFALKFELSDSRDPNQIEYDLCELIPQEFWISMSYAIKEYGRTICKARPHECTNHPCTRLYPRASKIWPTSK